MRPYDPLPHFHDPIPATIPRQSRWPIILGAGCWIAALVLVVVLVAVQVQ
jgi:hypothetical protein